MPNGTSQKSRGLLRGRIVNQPGCRPKTMMDRSTRHRLSKIEKLVSTALKKCEEKESQFRRGMPFNAQHHAIAVAAIALSGQPKIDEPLIKAWERALQHYGIEFNARGGMNDQVRAAKQLRPIIMEGKESSARFTEIFAAAPVWLLQFTGIVTDARWLKFQVPDMPSTLSWGSDGFEDVRQWPLLPSGTMTAGAPIPKIDWRQVWLANFCVVKGEGDPIQAFKDRDSFEEEQEEKFSSTGNPLLDEMIRAFPLFLEEEANPDREWLPHEKRHRRRVAERISRLTKESQERKRSRGRSPSPLRANPSRPKANRRKVRQRRSDRE
jgi:hypothetical protein